MRKTKTNNSSTRAKRQPLMIPVPKLAKQAEDIYTLRPSKAIILNILKDLYIDAVGIGYQRRIADHVYFKHKRDVRIKKSFDSLITYIDDTVHGGTTK